MDTTGHDDAFRAAVTGPTVLPSLGIHLTGLVAPGVTRWFTSLPALSAWPLTADLVRTLAPYREERCHPIPVRAY
jgi:hypothetical protein